MSGRGPHSSTAGSSVTVLAVAGYQVLRRAKWRWRPTALSAELPSTDGIDDAWVDRVTSSMVSGFAK